MADLLPDSHKQTRPLKELPAGYIKPSWVPPDTLPDLRGETRIAIDIETKDPDLGEQGPGVRREGNYICGIAIGLERSGLRCYLPVRHEGGGNLDPNMVFNWARAELNAFEGEVVGAQLLYDLDWLASERITFPKVKRFLDVQNAEPLLDENRRRFGLEYLAQDYLGATKITPELEHAKIVHKFKTDKQLKQNLWKLPANLVGAYAEGDVDLPLRILPHQLKRLEDEDLLNVFDIETRLIPMLLAMRRRGVRVDIERAVKLRSELIVRRDELLGRLKRVAGPKAELMAADSLGPALEEAGIKVPRTAKTRAYSVTKELLERHQHVPIAALIRDGRKINTIINMFLDGAILGHSINGRIHCEFNQLKRDEGGTISRFSSSNPNLQQIPARDGELAPLIRGLFIPEEGEVWERKDLSQIEYRFLVHYARGDGANEARSRYDGDPTLSFHKFAGELFGLTELTGETYKRIKNTNFCKVYGGGVGKLAETFGTTFEEAAAFNERYEKELPFVGETFKQAEMAAIRRGYIKTILGRRRRFPLFESPFKKGPPLPLDEARARYGHTLRRVGTRNALNGMLQGGAADFLKKAMVDIWDSGVCDVMGPPMLTVHDELDDSVPLTLAGEEASREAHELFERAVKLRVPVYAERTRGKNWGDCV